MKNIECDVAVIGGGPAGLAAAESAYNNGAENVIIIERDKYPGGILQQCIHNGFGIHILGKDKTGPEYAEHFINKLKKLPVKYFMETMVLEIADNLMINAVNKQGMITFNPRSIVLAMGCRERTRGAISLPGKRPSGIMTAGTAQRFINIEGYLPGKKIVILGSGDIGMIMARRLHLEGAEVKAVIEIMDCLGGLSRNLVQCLQDFKIPLYLKHAICDIKGDKRLESIEFAPLDENNRLVLDKKRTIECDTLLLSVGLIPENELSKQAGVKLDKTTRGPVVDQNFHTSVKGIFAAGNVVNVFDLVDYVSMCGEQAGKSAALYAKKKLKHHKKDSSIIKSGYAVGSVMPQILTDLNDNVKLYMRAKQTIRKPLLRIVDGADNVVFEKKLRIVRPAEMISVSVPDLKSEGMKYTIELIGGSYE